MHHRLTTIERNSLAATLTMATCLACSGSSSSQATSTGGSPANGGASTSAVTSSGTSALGGSTAGSGVPSVGGVGPTGSTVASGGDAALGGATTTTGVSATGGVVGGGGSTAGGATSAGGANTGGKSSAAGGKSATGGSSGEGTGGKSATGGTSAVGGASGAACPATVLKPGDSNQTVMVGSLSRSYVLHIPTGYNGTKQLAVVIDFHPLGATGSGWGGSNPWKTKADSAGFIMVYPNSYNSNNSWNAGMCCQDAQHNSIDDVAFTRAIVKQIEGIACVDPKRIYATGCSNGGGMTYKVACDAADIIAAAAPVDFRCVYGGTTNSPSCEGCKPSRPISITHFDNTGDNSLVPYNGGMTSFAADCPPNQSCTGMGFPSAQANFTTWQSIDQCTGSASAMNGHSVCQTNGTCQGGAQVSFCVQQGGSHCGNYASLGIVDIAWEMFQKASLP